MSCHSSRSLEGGCLFSAEVIKNTEHCVYLRLSSPIRKQSIFYSLFQSPYILWVFQYKWWISWPNQIYAYLQNLHPLRLSLSMIFKAFWLINAKFIIKHAQQTGHLTETLVPLIPHNREDHILLREALKKPRLFSDIDHISITPTHLPQIMTYDKND